MLVIQFSGDSTKIYDDMIAIEDELIETLVDEDVDGHDIGSGEANIFVFTEDPAGTFECAKPVLDQANYLDKINVAYRLLNEEDFIVE